MERAFANNEECLLALLELVSARLNTLTPPSGEGEVPSSAQAQELSQQFSARCGASREAGMPLPAEQLIRAFCLSEFEQHCLFMALAPELDERYAAYFHSVQEGRSDRPSLSLCLNSFAVDVHQRLTLLTHWRSRGELLSYLFESGTDSDPRQGLRLHSRVVTFLLDGSRPDPYLTDMMTEVWPDQEPEKLVLRQEAMEQVAQAVGSASPEQPLLFFFQGETGSGRTLMARHLCRALNLPLLIIHLPTLIQRPDPWEDLVRAILREARLRSAALAFSGAELLFREEQQPITDEDEPAREATWQGREHLRYLLRRAADMVDCLFLFSESPWRPDVPCEGWQRIELELPMPTAAQRRTMWEVCTGGDPLAPDVSLESLANKFALQPGKIVAAAEEARRLRRWEMAPAITGELLHRACRSQLPHSLSRLTSRVRTGYTWDDLILAPEQKHKLKEACDQVEYRRQVYDTWGFSGKVGYGRGVSMLFSGPPGTGKTMAAQVVANRLQLELYKVELSGVMSKYIGETEKQLGAVFDEVKKSQSILFFDEADALFGKRSETKDSHDRYANIQTSFLLQKMEEYDGIVILASNYLQNFDEAFKRRIKFIIDFCLPSREQREEIWRSVLPAQLPGREDVDFDFLARSFELSGSSIKNIALAAAFLAAAEGTPIRMTHLLLAVQAEQHKVGKSMGREDFGEYYYQVQQDRQNTT